MDYEALLEKCRTPQSKSLIDEAIRCYQAGSYRSSIIATWIAVVHDFLEKLRDLPLGGNGDAEAYIRKFESIYEAEKRKDPDALKRYLEFERTIIDVFKDKFEFLTSSEASDLYRLQQDRHRCAHPTVNEYDEIYRPSAELARLHLRNAVEYVLRRAAAQGKFALASLKKALESDFFPVDVNIAEQALKKGPLAESRSKVVRDFIGFLVDSFMAVDASSPKPNPPQAAAAINATLRIHQQVARDALLIKVESRLDHVEDNKLWLATVFVGMIPESWKAVPQVTKVKLTDYILRGSDGLFDLALAWAFKLEELEPMAIQRLNSYDAAKLAILTANTKMIPIINRALDLLENSGSYNETNHICRMILMPQVSIFDDMHVTRIKGIAGSNPEVAGGFGYQEIIDSLPMRLK